LRAVFDAGWVLVMDEKSDRFWGFYWPLMGIIWDSIWAYFGKRGEI
jgi:hypothetical protein